MSPSLFQLRESVPGEERTSGGRAWSGSAANDPSGGKARTLILGDPRRRRPGQGQQTPSGHLKRREVIALLGGAATWPLAARAQQRERVSRVARVGIANHGAAGDARVSECPYRAQRTRLRRGPQTPLTDRWADGRPDVVLGLPPNW